MLSTTNNQTNTSEHLHSETLLTFLSTSNNKIITHNLKNKTQDNTKAKTREEPMNIIISTNRADSRLFSIKTNSMRNTQKKKPMRFYKQ